MDWSQQIGNNSIEPDSADTVCRQAVRRVNRTELSVVRFDALAGVARSAFEMPDGARGFNAGACR
jgi:hypothetical protein